MAEIKLVIAEDSPRDQEFLASVLDEFDIDIASDGAQALTLINQHRPQYILSDIQLPGMNGIELAKSAWQLLPEARIVFWSHHADEVYLRALSRIIPADTVYGYVLKDSTSDVLCKALHQVYHDNQCWIDPRIRTVQAREQRQHSVITDAEYDVLIDIALGLTDSIIAQRHFLTRRGVQNRLKSLYQKLDVENSISDIGEMSCINSRTRAVAIAITRGLLNSDELAVEEESLQSWLEKEAKRER